MRRASVASLLLVALLVAACGTSQATLSDCVKEVAIFKAHRSVPLVITEEGETRFDPYAAGVLRRAAAAHSRSVAYPSMSETSHSPQYSSQ